MYIPEKENKEDKIMTDVETKSRALFSKSKPRLTPEEFEEKHLVPLKNFFLQMFGNSNYRITSSEV